MDDRNEVTVNNCSRNKITEGGIKRAEPTIHEPYSCGWAQPPVQHVESTFMLYK